MNDRPLETIRDRLRSRIAAYAFFFFVVWPLMSIAFGALLIREQTLAQAAPLWLALTGMSVALGKMSAEYLAVATIAFAAAVLFVALPAAATGGSLELERRSRAARFLLRMFEPLLFLIAAAAGLALEYPAVLRHPLVRVLRTMSVGSATVLLLMIAVGVAALYGFGLMRLRGAAVMAASAAATAGLFWGSAFVGVSERRGEAGAGNVVLLAIDSLAQSDRVAPLRDLTTRHRGVWYERPVAPGLLTNSVWPAILAQRPVHQTGVYFVCQSVDWSKQPFNLVQEARRRGFRTRSHFTGQFTVYVGSEAGFDVDASGPVGWLQIATAGLKDASLMMPAVLPRLPRLGVFYAPQNQAGTFTYDLRRDLADVLTGRSDANRLFTAAHFDYLHASNYPRYRDLDGQRRRAVRRARVDSVQDQSLDWQYPEIQGDPIGLYVWKMENIQRAIVQELAATGFLAADKRNRLVIFSDHGNRSRLQMNSFGRPEYYKVILATFGLPERDMQRPISLLDLAPLLGLADPRRPAIAEPVVEYTNGSGLEWMLLNESLRRGTRGSRLDPSGVVVHDPRIIERIGRRLTAFRPYTRPLGYSPAPAKPAAAAVRN